MSFGKQFESIIPQSFQIEKERNVMNPYIKFYHELIGDKLHDLQHLDDCYERVLKLVSNNDVESQLELSSEHNRLFWGLAEKLKGEFLHERNQINQSKVS